MSGFGINYIVSSHETQRVFSVLRDCISTHQEKVVIPCIDTDVVSNAAEMIILEHPEYFWFTGSVKMKPLGELIICFPIYGYTESQASIYQSDIERRSIEICKQTSDMSELERIKTVCTWILNNVTYDLSYVQTQNLYTVFIERHSACEGISSLTKYLLNKCGVTADTITGCVDGQGRHNWNLVMIDGQYLHIDLSLCYPEFSRFRNVGLPQAIAAKELCKEFFCVSTQLICNTHTIRNNEVLQQIKKIEGKI